MMTPEHRGMTCRGAMSPDISGLRIRLMIGSQPTRAIAIRAATIPTGTGGREKGRGSHGERNTGAGISDRGMDREMNDEEERPDRDPRQSER
jgi:hypothetical protein